MFKCCFHRTILGKELLNNQIQSPTSELTDPVAYIRTYRLSQEQHQAIERYILRYVEPTEYTEIF